MIDPIEQQAIGERIRHARRLRNMTQGDIAKAIGVKAAAVWQIENGRVPEKRIPQIAAALDVSIEDLLGGPVIADMTRDEAEMVRALRTLPAEGRAYIGRLMADLARGEVAR